MSKGELDPGIFLGIVLVLICGILLGGVAALNSAEGLNIDCKNMGFMTGHYDFFGEKSCEDYSGNLHRVEWAECKWVLPRPACPVMNYPIEPTCPVAVQSCSR
jgi:hypothetical protein